MKNLFIPLAIFAIAFLLISIIALEHGNNVTCRVFAIVSVLTCAINLFDNKNNQHNEKDGFDFRVPGDRICFDLDLVQQFRKRGGIAIQQSLSDSPENGHSEGFHEDQVVPAL